MQWQHCIFSSTEYLSSLAYSTTQRTRPLISRYCWDNLGQWDTHTWLYRGQTQVTLVIWINKERKVFLLSDACLDTSCYSTQYWPAVEGRQSWDRSGGGAGGPICVTRMSAEYCKSGWVTRVTSLARIRKPHQILRALQSCTESHRRVNWLALPPCKLAL